MATYDNALLYKAIKELKVVDPNQLDEAYGLCQKDRISLDTILFQKDLLSDENLGKIISDLISFPLIRLGKISIPHEVLFTIPQVVAKKQQIIAFKKDKAGLHLGMSDPSNIQIRDFVEKKIGLPVIAYYATKNDIDNALLLYRKDVVQVFDKIIHQNIHQAQTGTDSDPPVIKIVDTLISYGYQNKASDIHIEPWENDSMVRFRIDGVLHDIVKLPMSLHEHIVTRVKVLAKLRTDEHQAAQDGKLQWMVEGTQNLNGERLDIRISIVPATKGEKIVMRLLSERSRQFSLLDIGFSPDNLTKVEGAYKKPYGMVLVTGPTGSGKTTTAYAILKLLNHRNVNIMTIEDPVEYDIQGVNQIQVNPKTNLTFAAGLRSIVRQDPDIILVGEIRDNETAAIAVNSAMTGHLVLSTLHTNDAATAIPRLLDMGIEPFIVASTVNIIIAQRLVRKIHIVCRVSEEVDLSALTRYFEEKLINKIFGKSKTYRLYHGKGCDICHTSGYEGRVGIFEVLPIDDSVRESIVNRKDSGEIRTIAINYGMSTMMEDGLEKVKQGITTIEEVIRVTKE